MGQRLHWLLFINVFLAVMQSVFFILTRSLAVLSETGDSFADAASLLVILYSHKSIRHILINSLAFGLRLTLFLKSIEELISQPDVDEPALICATAGASILVNVGLILIGVDKDDGDEIKELSWAIFIDFGFDALSSMLSLTVGVVLFFNTTAAVYTDKITALVSNFIFLAYQSNLLRKNIRRHLQKQEETAAKIAALSASANGKSEAEALIAKRALEAATKLIAVVPSGATDEEGTNDVVIIHAGGDGADGNMNLSPVSNN